MLGLTITISGNTHHLDLFEDSEFKINSSFAEIQNITQRNSTYSNSFFVPGSKDNNDVFQHFFYLNSTFTDFDIRRKMDAVMTFNGYEIMSGYIRLNFVNVENRQVLYNITFYSEVGNLVANIGDKLMIQLDLDDMKHPYDAFELAYESIKDPDLVSPTGTTAYETGKSYWFLGHFGYEYTTGNTLNTTATPKLNFSIIPAVPGLGYFDDPQTPLQSVYIKPSVQFKELYTRIFNQAGYDVESDFFETAYFKRYYLPQTFNGEGLYLKQGVDIQYQSIQSGDPITFSALTWTNLQPSVYSQNTERIKLTPTTLDNISGNSITGDYIFQVNNTGIYEAVIDINVYNNARLPGLTRAELDVYFRQITAGTATGNTLYEWSILVSSNGAGSATLTFSWFANAGDSFCIDTLRTPDALGGQAIITNFNFNILKGPNIVEGDFDYALEFPDDKFKQIEFIQAVNNLFNLVIVPKVDEPRTLIVEPIIDFIGKGPVLDWTKKVDNNQPIQISPTTNVINGVINFNIEQDTDNGNEQFANINNQTFGFKQLDLNTDYKESQTDFGSVFGSSVDYVVLNQQFSNATLPIFFVLETTENEGQVQQFFRPFRTLPRPLFRGVNLPGRNLANIPLFGPGQPAGVGLSWYLNNTEIDVFNVNNRFTTYPFGVSGFSHYTNYNSRHYYDITEAHFPDYDDMESIYYREYLEDFTNEDNRILDCYVYLTAEEIKDIQFNEKIFIDGNYYRINKIEGYDFNSEAPVSIQFVKLTADYTPHKVAYFDLIACGGYPNKHTNTDLTYGIFAFVGNYWKIGDNCYEVVRGEYNPSYNYEAIKTTYYGNDSLIPVVYTDCECVIRSTILDVYTDVVSTPLPTQPLPSPTPTPSITPTQTPTPGYVEGCNEYTIQNNTENPEPYFYQDCCTSEIIDSELGAFGSIVVCSTEVPGGLITWYLNGICENPCGDITPTPTPTNTQTPTQTATPNPTPTPTATPGYTGCYIYEITNNSEEPLEYEHIPCGDCEQPSILNILPAGNNVFICACPGSVSIFAGSGIITQGGACG